MLDDLVNTFNAIPTGSSCDSDKTAQQNIMYACHLYNKLTNQNIGCSVCKWQGAIKPAIVKYLKGCGKL
jgi:hypothetical protein